MSTAYPIADHDEAGTVPTDREASVPVIDISAFETGSAEQRQDIVDRIGAACRSIGFFVITGHAVPDDLVERVHRVSRSFYDLPDEQKANYKAARRGYFGAGKQTVAKSMDDRTTPPDTHEIFVMGRDWFDPADPYFSGPIAQKVFSKNNWPTIVEGFEEAWIEYYNEMEKLAKRLMRIFELALDLPDGWFWERGNRHMSTMSAINYPAPTGDPLPNQRRLGAHTDFGAFTLLKAENKPGSLEVQAKDGVWEAVPILPDAYIVNVGDMLKRWTNDVWESSLHRVTNPPRDAGGDSRRLSLVFFFHPNHDAIITPMVGRDMGPPKYPPIGAGELLVSRLDKIRGVKTD